MALQQPYPLEKISHIRGVDHPESIAVGPQGEAYTTGTGGQVYRVDLATNTVQQFASTAPRRTLGQAVDADGNLYIADCSADGKVIRITPAGQETIYARGPGGRPFVGTNYPVFDRHGNLYLSDAGTYRDVVDGYIYKIPPGGGEAALWYPQPLATPNKMALDADESYLYFCESHGLARIAINPDGSAGAFERLIHTPYLVPHGLPLTRPVASGFRPTAPTRSGILTLPPVAYTWWWKIGWARRCAAPPISILPGLTVTFYCSHRWIIWSSIALTTLGCAAFG